MSLGISRKLCSPHLPLAAQFETCSFLTAAAARGEVHMGLSVLRARSDHVLFTQHCCFFDVGHTLGISEIWSATSVPGTWLGLAVWSRRFSTQTRTCKGPSPQCSSGNFLTLYHIHGINQMSQGALRPVPMEASWYHESGSGSGPKVHPNSCPLSQWCHPTTSSSIIPFSSCPQSFPASCSFPMRQFFASGGQSIGASASASVLPMNIQDWFPLGLTVWSSCSPRDSQESSPTPQFKSVNSSVLRFLYVPTFTSIHDYWKTITLTRQTFVGKVLSLLFNVLSRFVIAFLPRSKHVLISWLQSPSAVILEPRKIVCCCFCFFPIYLPWNDGTEC